MSRQGWLSAVLGVLLIGAAILAYYFYQAREAEEARLQSALAITKADLEELAAEQRQLEETLAGARQRLAQRTTSADQLEAELDQALQALNATEEELRKATESRGQLEAERDRLAAELAAMSALLAGVSAELEQSQARAEGLSGQLTEAEQRIQQIGDERDRLSAALEVAVASERRLATRAVELERQLADARQALEQLQAEQETVTARYLETQAELAQQAARAETASETVAELEARLAAERAAMDTLEGRLQALTNEKDTLVSRLEDGTTVIKLPESILFDSGSARIGESGRQTLQLLATALTSFPDHLISVQGHSDSRPIAPSLQDRYPTNWELSSARAASAVRVLTDTGIQARRMQAVGYADTRPLVPETDATSRRTNRRIEVLLYPPTLTVRPRAVQPAPSSPES